MSKFDKGLRKFFKEMEQGSRTNFQQLDIVVGCNYECETSGYRCGHRTVCPGADYMRQLRTEREKNPHVAGTGPSEVIKKIAYGVPC